MALLDELSRGSEALAHPLVAHSLGQALARQLLFGQPHDLAHLLDKPAPPSSRTVVRMVEEYLEAHATEAIRVADLAALTGASVRSIEAAFRAQRGSTPGAFLRSKRLMLARQRLLASEPGVTATHVAYATGFLRRARFDAAYLQQFGETPDETQRRGLIANGAPPSSSSRPSPVPASVRGSSEERGDLATRFAALSPRERQVCEGVGRGMLNKQIAADLGISGAHGERPPSARDGAPRRDLRGGAGPPAGAAGRVKRAGEEAPFAPERQTTLEREELP